MKEAQTPEKPHGQGQSAVERFVKPVVVCLCGSTRFSQAFRDANLKETLDGKIVLSIGCDMRSDDHIFGGLPEDDLMALKQRLDTLHLRKIDLADEVLILNVGGYIGESTRRELDYALKHGKPVRYLETPAAVFKCGPGNEKCKCNCPDACEHVWDGKPYYDGGMGSATCSRCGMLAINHDMMVLP